MVDIIIVLIVIVLLGFALKGSIKHFKGESPCCGGGGGEIVLDIPDKKLENPILGKKVLKISGMHCEHCVKAVTEAINKIDGAAAKGHQLPYHIYKTLRQCSDLPGIPHNSGEDQEGTGRVPVSEAERGVK